MRFRSSLCVALAALALAACAGHRKLDLPREQVAEVRGLDELVLLGTERHLVFEEIDGQKLKGGFFSSLPKTIDLAPGKHTLRCSYSVRMDGMPGPSGSMDVELEAKAGAAYQGSVVLGELGEAKVVFVEIPQDELQAERAKATAAAAARTE